MVCKWCGLETDGVDVEYLAGVEHLECAISAEMGRRPIRIQNLHRIVGEMGSADTKNIVVTEADENSRIFRIRSTDGGNNADMELDRWETEEGGLGGYPYRITIERVGGGKLKASGRMDKRDITPKGIVKVFEGVWWEAVITPF